jgi:hypothetical protein
MISALIFIRYNQGICIVILAYEYFATTWGNVTFIQAGGKIAYWLIMQP